MRLSTYHKRRGDEVHLRLGFSPPELFERPDKIYISCLFSWNRREARRLASCWEGRAELSGTGIDYKKELPMEVQQCPPDYSLYGKSRAIGFISRGCNNRCPWCVVWRKEGKLHRVSTAREVVGDFDSAIFLDNNHLALPDYRQDLVWLAENQIAIDFNQGMDAKHVTEKAAELLAACKWLPGSTIRLALDSCGRNAIVTRAVERLERVGISRGRITVYALIGFAGLQSDIERLLLLHRLGVRVFPMGYRNLETGEEPMKEWKPSLYRKYRRLIVRMPMASSIWDDFKRDLTHETIHAS